MYRTLDDIEGRYAVVPPEEGVSLAEIHNVPYSPDYAVLEDGSRIPRIAVRPWSYEYPDALANADGFSSADMRPLTPMPVASPEGALPGAGISLADLVRTISPAADSEAWREDNVAPFWTLDDPRAISGSPSFDDLVRTIDPSANPDLWRDDSTTPQYAGWDDAERHAVPYDPRATGAFVPAINPTADAAVWSESNVAPFWHTDDPYAPSAGVAFGDLVRPIASIADPDIWPPDRSTPLDIGQSWDGASASASERYAVPSDRTRAAALGAFEIPGLPEDAAGWRLSEATPAGAGGISLAQLENGERNRIIDLLREPAAAILRALIMRRFGGKLPPGPQPSQPKPGASKPTEQPAQPKSSTQGGHAVSASTTSRDILAPGGQPIGTRHAGASEHVRTTPSSHFDEIYSRLKSGSKLAEPPRGYDGSAFERSDGIVIGERVSKQHGRTLEVLRSNDPLLPQGFKVHQK